MDELTTWMTPDTLDASVFATAFLLVALWEGLRPARSMTLSMSLRWFGNIALFLASWPLVVFLPFLTAVGGALIARENGLGFFNLASAPVAVVLPLSVIMLDFLGYWEHRLFHAAPVLWRLHALHHSDPDLDVTTVVRHHPLEVLVQAGLDAFAAIVFGFPPAAIVLYRGSMSVVQVMHHGNIELPKGLHWIGRVIVTPELHRVHHSVVFEESNSNFSNLLSIWDQAFGTLRLSPRGELRLGLTDFSSVKFQRLDKMLLLPLLIPR